MPDNIGTLESGMIDYSEQHCPMFRMQIGKREFGFSVCSFPEEKHEWLRGMLARQIADAYHYGMETAMKKTRKAAKEFFGNILGLPIEGHTHWSMSATKRSCWSPSLPFYI